VYLRDHVLGQMELADASDDPAQRQARCTFVVVGAGLTGTEVATRGQLFTRAALRRYPRIRPDELRWLLVDRAPAIIPELGPRLGDPALRILRRRGLDVRLETTLEQATDSQVRLSDGTTVPTRTLVWCVGVTPGPVTQALGLETSKGRIVVDEFLTVPGHPDVFAAGDAAAVPDLTRPGQLTAMTAQHAQRQGKTAARNLCRAVSQDAWLTPERGGGQEAEGAGVLDGRGAAVSAELGVQVVHVGFDGVGRDIQLAGDLWPRQVGRQVAQPQDLAVAQRLQRRAAARQAAARSAGRPVSSGCRRSGRCARCRAGRGAPAGPARGAAGKTTARRRARHSPAHALGPDRRRPRRRARPGRSPPAGKP
jgi:NADPH-dependent 2,4-dienoyl-CoA reductase/sulfur reductase-like enzyme